MLTYMCAELLSVQSTEQHCMYTGGRSQRRGKGDGKGDGKSKGKGKGRANRATNGNGNLGVQPRSTGTTAG